MIPNPYGTKATFIEMAPDLIERMSAEGPPYIVSSNKFCAIGEWCVSVDRKQGFRILRVATKEEYEEVAKAKAEADCVYFYEVEAMD